MKTKKQYPLYCECGGLIKTEPKYPKPVMIEGTMTWKKGNIYICSKCNKKVKGTKKKGY